MDLRKLANEFAGYILRHPEGTEWEVQGLGMMRCRIGTNLRLHIWHRDLKTVHTSDIHTHPWWFDSYVVSGYINETLYGHTGQRDDPGIWPPSHNRRLITCGPGDPAGEDSVVDRYVTARRFFPQGSTYSLSPIYYHQTSFLDGTVTVIERTPVEDPKAYVLWPTGTEFQSAEPRPATPEEIERYTGEALNGLSR